MTDANDASDGSADDRPECRAPWCGDPARVDAPTAFASRFCSDECEVRFEHLRADARDARADDDGDGDGDDGDDGGGDGDGSGGSKGGPFPVAGRMCAYHEMHFGRPDPECDDCEVPGHRPTGTGGA